MNPQKAIDYIHSIEKFGSILGLEHISALCEKLGNPQKRLKFIHVAGTNGKGSTTAYISNILMSAGYKVGTYISPFVHTFFERIQINGQNIDPEALARHASTIRDTGLEVTEFEFITALGFLYFLEQKCDYVVLEVGLGGRFDATNVIDCPEVAVLTSIDIDHTEYLGDTVEKIAFEKCGIIKDGARVAIYPDQHHEAIEVINRVCLERNARAFYADKGQAMEQNTIHTVFELDGERYEISLLGEHQIMNACTAITAINCLDDLKITTEHIKQGLVQTRFSGRFEIINKNPVVVIDGAHNYSGCEAFANAVEAYFSDKNVTIVLGMLADKEYKRCIRRIAPLAKKIVLTRPDNLRALDPAEVLDYTKQFCNDVEIISDRFEAVRQSLDSDVLCICGSLYLIGGMPDFVENCLAKV